MFAKLFMDSGLSLERLKAFVEVGAAGSIVQACEGDPVRQSQYSRQIKELEDFFQTRLAERHGKGLRLTPNGKELARISRFFLLGLSNFRRGCLTEVQTFRIGASAIFIQQRLLPFVGCTREVQRSVRYALETVSDEAIERRLHELTLDFGVVTTETLSRPLQLRKLGSWRLKLWAPKALCRSSHEASEAFRNGRLPWVLPVREFPRVDLDGLKLAEPCLTCDTFPEARTTLEQGAMAAFLPEFMDPENGPGGFVHVPVAAMDRKMFHEYLAWNPRLLRLNPHAVRTRANLLKELARRRPPGSS